VCFMVFWIPSPTDSDEAFAAYDVYLDPHSDIQVATWRELAAQSHWHLFLVSAGGGQRGFFEFENTFNLDENLDFVLQATRSIPLVDFNRAKAKFMDEHTLEELRRIENPSYPAEPQPSASSTFNRFDFLDDSVCENASGSAVRSSTALTASPGEYFLGTEIRECALDRFSSH
jgi:hypothetical protein